ncbi:Methyltransferase domain-containing protein [Chitinophaga eiseniae]|uniref:Methyltransferase domain-containing protein n=1 Tax=Chitinophaga eiseniae TaxID=634771 RepID=A0A1T4NSA6_9BACT|nr:class I SAM-dependent methyltransferase [Chitinophaga eiseniae]SJZ81578.1 Methyltransferase domain-containing protein [Chitinophaga eiseniae]
MKNTERFSNRVTDYEKYRPHYPVAIIPYLSATTGLSHSSVIADIGSGTGLSAQPFLDNGNTVYAVEPNEAMRASAEQHLGRFPGFKSVAATAEHTSLPNHSVDLIVAGQAFHWFDQELTRKEFHRIAKPDAYAALMWNLRSVSTPFEQDYEQLLQEHGVDYKHMQQRHVGPMQLAAFFLPGTFKEKTFQNAQRFDFKALKGLLSSSSYMPARSHENYPAMIKDLEDIFHKYQEQGMVTFKYETKLYTGRLSE